MGEKRSLTNKLSGDLARTYSIYQKVLANVLRPFANLKAKESSIPAAKFKIHLIVSRLNVEAVKWSRAATAQAYKSKRIEVAPLAKAAAVFAAGQGPDPVELRISDLANKIAEEFVNVNTSIEKTCHAFLAAYETAMGGARTARQNTQIQSMDAAMEAEISKKVSWYASRGYSEGAISRKLRDYLSELIDGENFIEINGRFYALKSFAEQLARTSLHEIFVKAAIDESIKWGNDLMQFSRHDSPCDLCAPLEGMVFSISGNDPDFPALNDPVPVTVDSKTGSKTVYVDPRLPHPRCCLPGTMIEAPGNIIAGSKLFYSGWQVDLALADGARISVTKNHLFLTPNGFAPAHLLREGDDIFYCPVSERMIAAYPNDHGQPAAIEEIIAALAKIEGMGSGSMPISPEDFHGDGRFIHGDINVIGTDSFLWRARKSGLPQKTEKENFHITNVGASNLSGSGDFTTVLKSLALAADSIVGGRRAAVPFFLARASGSDSVTLRNSPEIAVDFSKPDMNGLIGNPKLLCEIAFKSTRPIQTQKIIAVNRIFYHGFVYDLQTEASLYIANGVLSSNCEHNLNPVTRAILVAAGEL